MRCWLILLAALVGCGVEQAEDEETEATADALQSPPMAQSEMKKIPIPAGMPAAWEQPDSTGWFDERGKCGPTAVANTLRLYGKEVSPAQADHDGVNWLVGTRGINIEPYLQRQHPELNCTLEHPTDGPAFLRKSVDGGHPVMVWFNMSGGFLGSHWITVVGRRGAGANERAIVMSWGDYYEVPMSKLDAAWRNVYAIRRPSIVCAAKTTHIAR